MNKPLSVISFLSSINSEIPNPNPQHLLPKCCGFNFLYVLPLFVAILRSSSKNLFHLSSHSKILPQISISHRFHQNRLHALALLLSYDDSSKPHKGAGQNMETQFEDFFQGNERRIHFQIHRLRIPHNLYDEFYTEGIVALWQAYQDVDQAKGNIGTFLNYRIRYRLIDLIRKKQRETELDEKFFQHRVTEMTDGTRHRDSNTPLLNTPNLPVTDDTLWQHIQEQLTANQWKWIRYFIIADLSLKEIMEIENVSADAVKGWGRAARKKLCSEATKKLIQEHIQK